MATLVSKAARNRWKSWLWLIGVIALAVIIFWAIKMRPATGELAVNCPSQPEVLSDISKPEVASSIGREVEYKLRDYGAYIPRVLDREIKIGEDTYKLELSCSRKTASPYPNQSIPCRVILLKNGQPTSDVPDELKRVELGMPGSNSLKPEINRLLGTGFDRTNQEVNVAALIRGVPFITTASPYIETRNASEDISAEILELKGGRAEFTFHTGYSSQAPYVEVLATAGEPNKLAANTILCYSDIVGRPSELGPGAHQAKGDFYYDVKIKPTYSKHADYAIAEVQITARRANGQVFTNPYQRVRVTYPLTAELGTFLATTADSNLSRSTTNGLTTDPELIKLFIQQALTRSLPVHYDSRFPTVSLDLIDGRGKAYLLMTKPGSTTLTGVAYPYKTHEQKVAPYVLVQPYNYYPVEMAEFGVTSRQDSIDRPFVLPVAGSTEAYRISHKISKPSPPDNKGRWFMYGGTWLEQPFPTFYGAVAFPANPLANKIFTIAPIDQKGATLPGSTFAFYTIWIVTLLLAQLILEGLGISIWRMRKKQNAKR